MIINNKNYQLNSRLPIYYFSGICQENIFNSRGEYNIYTNNCHLAQQDVREALGINVENPYKPL